MSTRAILSASFHMNECSHPASVLLYPALSPRLSRAWSGRPRAPSSMDCAPPPRVAVGIDEDSRVSAPRGRGAEASYGRPRLLGLGEDGVDPLGRADVERQSHPSPAAPVLDAAVLCELGAVPKRKDEPAGLEEGDVVGVVVGAPTNAPPERLVERCARDTSRTPRVIRLSRCSIAPSFLSPIRHGTTLSAGADGR